MLDNRAYTFLGLTQSLCPECLQVVPAKIITRGKRVYFRKQCKDHGTREDYICSDVAWFDRFEHAQPAKAPKHTSVQPDKGCPYDCGLCSEHEQHTCIGVLEITDACNLSCPMCYANSRPGLKHKSFDQITAAINALVKAEGRPEVLQLSGGEPTVHPQLEQIIDYALAQPIDYVMLNTNGLRLASDDALLEKLANHRERIEVYLQFDGFNDDIYQALRGEPLLDKKLQAIERIGAAELNVTIVATLQAGVNGDQLGALIEFAKTRPWITGLSLQPATYSGRHFLPEELEQRITFPDVITGLCEQTDGLYQPSDFFPLPCAHPNCHILSLAARHENTFVPLTRIFDLEQSIDLLANGLAFTKESALRMVSQYLARQNCCGPGGCDTGEEVKTIKNLLPVFDSNQSAETRFAEKFINDVLGKQLGAKHLFRITITSFLDAYNFDLRRVMKCCTHHVLPSGHIIPFCAYNVLYRNGHVPLPTLIEQVVTSLPDQTSSPDQTSLPGSAW